MSVAGSTGYRSAADRVRSIAERIADGFDPIRTYVVCSIDDWFESMATGLDGMLEEL